MKPQSSIPLLEAALVARMNLLDPLHETAFRLFNGFTEGFPDLVIDIYGQTALLHNYTEVPEQGTLWAQAVREFLQDKLPWLRAGIVKTRNGNTQDEKRGILLFGEQPDHKIKEHDIWYAIDLRINRDASLYLDTRLLRKWMMQNTKGRTVANFFAYTGSLGVAALAGGASRVLQLDLNRQFLDLAKASHALNSFPIHKEDFSAGDFFEQVGKLKRTGETFGCVIIDPPFFSTTAKGRIDQEQDGERIINKVRPLVNDGGYLIAINNAMYVSGWEYMQVLESICKDGYLRVRELIPVPEEFTGYPETRAGRPITDPAPFNYSTKIAVLQVKRM